MKILLRTAIVCLLVLAACACGNKGQLVMPDPPEPASSP